MKVASYLVSIFLTAVAFKSVQGLVCNQCGKFIPTSVLSCRNLANSLQECPLESTHCAIYTSPAMVVYDCAKDCKELAIWSFDVKCYNTIPQPGTRAPATADRTRLTEKFLRDYNKIIPDNVSVNFSISLIDFQVLRDKQALEVQAWILEEWVDHRIKWNPVPNGGLTQINWESDWVWKPDITLLNSKDSAMMKCWDSNVIVKENGTVTWMQSCSMMPPCNISRDSNDYIISNCTLKFGSWTYNGNEIDINPQEDDIDLSHLENTSGFGIVGYRMKKNSNVYVGSAEPFYELEYELALKSNQT